METNDEKTPKNTHHGHAIKRLRRTAELSQQALASQMGVSQSEVCRYERQPVIKDEMIDRFAEALHIAPTFIKEWEEDPLTVTIENNTLEKGNIIAKEEFDSNENFNNDENFNNTYNPIEAILELNRKNEALYERIIELEKEKSTLLEKLLNDKK